MNDVVSVSCPYCFETAEIYVDPECEGSWVEDCPVCCHPWAVHVSRDHRGEPEISIDRAS